CVAIFGLSRSDYW
nr:immunoglobulin heavy chain junction region [Macaca mulatta]MOV43731.1 immunoglobulin heavy chain junction region [Macaca mulatta]MOV44890.1 immunoglobulin heavy chain junction region [Macaca mulatta]MOV45931.1 immunoglobulin heavy chain junction region [Macaca mulatta]MOV46786.1 immunoglobulin heavy chain junction region [Macaca mulatta]